MTPKEHDEMNKIMSQFDSAETMEGRVRARMAMKSFIDKIIKDREPSEETESSV